MRESLIDMVGTLAGSSLQKRAISNPEVLNEAHAYAKPSSFSRGMRIDLGELAILLISGTASIDERGNSVHIGDFRAQMRRTLHNITGLLAAEGGTWSGPEIFRPPRPSTTVKVSPILATST